MPMNRAKIFKNGSSQAVRLPKEFRLKGKSATITHLGNAIVLQPTKETWNDIYSAMVEVKDFMKKKEDLPLDDREEF